MGESAAGEPRPAPGDRRRWCARPTSSGPIARRGGRRACEGVKSTKLGRVDSEGAEGPGEGSAGGERELGLGCGPFSVCREPSVRPSVSPQGRVHPPAPALSVSETDDSQSPTEEPCQRGLLQQGPEHWAMGLSGRGRATRLPAVFIHRGQTGRCELQGPGLGPGGAASSRQRQMVATWLPSKSSCVQMATGTPSHMAVFTRPGDPTAPLPWPSSPCLAGIPVGTLCCALPWEQKPAQQPQRPGPGTSSPCPSASPGRRRPSAPPAVRVDTVLCRAWEAAADSLHPCPPPRGIFPVALRAPSAPPPVLELT